MEEGDAASDQQQLPIAVSEGDASSCDLEFFQEKAEVLDLITNMCDVAITEAVFNVLCDTLNKRMLKYLEQSQLVRPHICDLLVPLNEKLSIAIDQNKVSMEGFSCFRVF